MINTMGTMTKGRMRLRGTSLARVSYSTRPSTHSREPNFTCVEARAQGGRVWAAVASPERVPRPSTAPPALTHNELGEVVCCVSLLPPLGWGLNFWGFAVQVGLGQRLHNATFSTHKCFRLLQRHGLVQIGSLGGGTGGRGQSDQH